MARIASLDVNLTGNMDGLSKNFKKAAEDTKSFASEMDKLVAGPGGIEGLIAGAFAGVTVSAAFAYALKQFNEVDEATFRLQETLASTSTKAFDSVSSIKQMAVDMSTTTRYTQATVLDSAANLARFGDLNADMFKDALSSAADYATVMGKDLPAATQELAKALDDPRKGYLALAQAGVRFTDAETDAIAKMQDAGDIAGAQQVILKAYHDQFDGAAAAAARLPSGQWKTATNAVGNYFSDLGGDLVNSILGSPLDKYPKQIKPIDRPLLTAEQLSSRGSIEEMIRNTVSANKYFTFDNAIRQIKMLGDRGATSQQVMAATNVVQGHNFLQGHEQLQLADKYVNLTDSLKQIYTKYAEGALTSSQTFALAADSQKLQADTIRNQLDITDKFVGVASNVRSIMEAGEHHGLNIPDTAELVKQAQEVQADQMEQQLAVADRFAGQAENVKQIYTLAAQQGITQERASQLAAQSQQLQSHLVENQLMVADKYALVADNVKGIFEMAEHGAIRQSDVGHLVDLAQQTAGKQLNEQLRLANVYFDVDSRIAQIQELAGKGGINAKDRDAALKQAYALRGKEIAVDNENPFERFKREMTKLNDVYQHGGISRDTFNRARAKLVQQAQSGMPQGIAQSAGGAAAAAFGSSSAYGAILTNRFRAYQTPQNELKQIAAEQLQSQKNSEWWLRQLVSAQPNIAPVAGL